MKTFKNKASRNGYVFGQVCSIVGVLMILVSLITMETAEHTINIKGFMTAMIGFLVYKYGDFRTGGLK